MKLYSIKPLKWTKTDFGCETSSVFGHMMVMAFGDKWKFGWSYSGTDNAYSDKSFKTERSAKLAAEAFYQNRLKRALTSKQEN